MFLLLFIFILLLLWFVLQQKLTGDPLQPPPPPPMIKSFHGSFDFDIVPYNLAAFSSNILLHRSVLLRFDTENKNRSFNFIFEVKLIIWIVESKRLYVMTLGQRETDNINRMITLTVITLSRFHCTCTLHFFKHWAIELQSQLRHP